MTTTRRIFLSIAATTVLPAQKLFPVKPITSAALGIRNSQYFSYAMPPGWRVGEDGQFALTLLAPDSKALTVMVGNAGFPTVDLLPFADQADDDTPIWPPVHH